MTWRVSTTLWCVLSTSGCGTSDSSIPSNQSASDLLTAQEVSDALNLSASIKAMPLRSQEDTARRIAEAAFWTWEGQGNPKLAIRLYCAALRLGMPDPWFHRMGALALNSLQAYGAEVDFSRAAAQRWPIDRSNWDRLAKALELSGRHQDAASILTELTAGKQPTLPPPAPNGCEAALAR
jgi:hypothetical protein